ncbi:hypothetical protein [Catalinimonas niigatensis]|uniref:hypothetical protein n=1 Tax=Catalinimonas niigatensis TaxID=1397264 RepID=UPI002665A433|nr:hypothetical protein [Catalinimonas niigatensis]WPP51385.1 hypothetical protein PZB72_03165 [Catalinimonas niigatensis]
MRQTIDQKISRISIAVDNSLNYPEIQNTLKKVGYTLPMLQQGKGYLGEFRMLQENHALKYGNQYGVGSSFREELQGVKATHAVHRKLAKIAYASDKSMQTQLSLQGKLTFVVDKWLTYANNFYTLLLKDSSRMAQYGVSAEELAQMQASVQALMANRNKHIACKGEAQHATQKRNEVIRKLDAWMSDFRKAARFAFKDEPQMLEMLGIMVKAKV